MGAYNNLKINNGVWNVNRVGRVLFFMLPFFCFFLGEMEKILGFLNVFGSDMSCYVWS